jgi:ribonucleotide monophosphatase NagD (HAD superfamily)
MRVALEALWRELSGGAALSLQQTVYGKPFPAQYRFVEGLLADLCAADAAKAAAAAAAAAAASGPAATAAAWYPATSAACAGGGSAAAAGSPLERFYMVGDNPATDIRGATAAGRQWTSILTRSGLWRGGGSANDANDPAHAVVQDVREAVEWVLAQELALGGLPPAGSPAAAGTNGTGSLAAEVCAAPQAAMAK